MAQPSTCIFFSKTVSLRKKSHVHSYFSARGNFEKTTIDFSSSMTADDVKKNIQEKFPYLKNKR